VTDIPEFTIGPGSMNPVVERAEKDPEIKSSKSSHSKDEEAPFKSL
jgi:hypothetical protein